MKSCSWSHHKQRWISCGSKEGRRHSELESTEKCSWNQEFHWNGQILLCFIEGVSKIARPMTTLLENKVEFK
jgi:hypothetical protein